MFTKNVGTADRILRLILGVGLIWVFFLYPETGLKWLALVVGLVMLFTAFMSSCMLYRVFGIKTSKE